MSLIRDIGEHDASSSTPRENALASGSGELDDRWRAEVDALIAMVLAREEPYLCEVGLTEQMSALRSLLLTGGKRMRAVCCYWGWRGAGGGDEEEDIRTAATALELNFFALLLHDDILDHSDTRRGQPTLHRQLATEHTRHGWAGDSDAFGDALALVLGDACLSMADELIGHCATGERLRTVLDLYHRMYRDTAYGVALEMQIQADRDFDLERCLRVLTYKAARYMFAPPLRIGATLAGAPAGIHRAYATFGATLGEAYQLRDDLLGVFGDPAVTGKPNLDDLREGKPTVLFATALQQATDHQRRDLLASYGRGDLDHQDAEQVRILIRETGAVQAVEDMIGQRSRHAAQALDSAPITDQVRDGLTRLATRALFRTR
jgi:geranylgeranyl diphosphate synthase, type I